MARRSFRPFPPPRIGHFARIGDARVHVLEEGAGPPVVLLHGLGGMAQEVLAPLVPLARSFRLLAPDRPGYGHSDLSALRPGWLQAVLREQGVRSPILLAHSIASIPALRLAFDHPAEIASLVLVAPFCRPTPEAFMPLLRLAVAPVIGRLFRRHVAPRLVRPLAPGRLAALCAPEPVPATFRDLPLPLAARADALLAMAEDLHRFNEAAARIGAEAPRSRVPTLLLAGTRDPVTEGTSHAAWLARRLGRARLIEVPGAGHMLHHTRSALVAEAVLSLAGVLRPARGESWPRAA